MDIDNLTYILICDECGENLYTLAAAYDHNHDEMIPARFEIHASTTETILQ